MNKRGGIFLGVMVAIMLFMVGVICLNLLTPEVTIARNSDNLDCSNTAGISDGNKLTCLIVGISMPYYIILFISIAGGFIIGNLR